MLYGALSMAAIVNSLVNKKGVSELTPKNIY